MIYPAMDMEMTLIWEKHIVKEKNIVGEKKRLAKTELKKTHYKKSYSHFKTGEILE